MAKEMGAATPEGDSPATVSSSADTYASKSAKNQVSRTVLASPLGHLVGWPVVVVDEVQNAGARVWIGTRQPGFNGSELVASPPWGWSGFDKDFLCLKPRSSMAWRYADELVGRIHLKAVDELELRHRRDTAKRRERDERQ